MTFTIIFSDKFKTIKWSGGTTKQLFIFPDTANYQQRDFEFRLSTATVEVERSEFTSLAGISRKLMVLDGKITLIHKDHRTIELNKFDVESFEGDWQTSSIGRCTDFNLMTNANTKGEISAIEIKENESINRKIAANINKLFIYVHLGRATINLNHTLVTLNKGDLILINNPVNAFIEINSFENSELIFTEIS